MLAMLNLFIGHSLVDKSLALMARDLFSFQTITYNNTGPVKQNILG